MSWTALVPLKGSTERKSRLASCLSPGERWQLTETMFRHVTSVLRKVGEIERIVVVSDRCPTGWQEDWMGDKGCGLNQELEAARTKIANSKLLVINADLPFLLEAEVDELLASALAAKADGCAIAPDRHDKGTNALALATASSFRLSFGTESFKRHRDEAGGNAAIVKQFGLAFDVDTPEDYQQALAYGMKSSGRN